MNSWIVAVAVVAAAVLSYVLTCLVRIVAPRIGLLDSPDNDRKRQASPVSLGGGVAVYAALVGVILVVTPMAIAHLPWDASWPNVEFYS